MIQETISFEPLPMRRRAVLPMNMEEYSIISVTGEVKQVIASTAYEAFRLSGFATALKIERKAVMKPPVLAKNRFSDEAIIINPEELMDPRRRSPVVSADDLDTLMRALHAVEHVSLPMDQTPIPEVITNPTGMEVHGDGFDEIIPANVAPMQMTGIKSAADTVSIDEPPAEELLQTPTNLLPQQELTPDEVNKLLNG